MSVGVAVAIPAIGFTDPITGTFFGVKAAVEFSGGLTVNDFRIRLNDPDGRFRVFETDQQPDRLFDTAGTVDAGVKVEIVAHTPIPLLEDIVLYSKTIASHRLLDLNSEVHKTNPFKPPPNQPPQKRPMIFDLNSLPEANDGVPNVVSVQQAGGLYRITVHNGVNGPLVFSQERPVNQVSEIIVSGGGDDDHFFLGTRDVTVDGRGGHNSIQIDDRPSTLRITYDFRNGLIGGNAHRSATVGSTRSPSSREAGRTSSR